MLGIFGAVLGAVGLSVLTFTYHAIFYPTLVGDETYFVHYLLTAPVGACLGAGAIYGLTLTGNERKKAAGAYLAGSFAATLVLLALAYWQEVKTLAALGEVALLYLPVSLAYISCLLAGIFLSINLPSPKAIKKIKVTKTIKDKDETNKDDKNTTKTNT